MTTLIRTEHLSRHFHEVRAVDDLTLQVEAGEIYGLVGPDGAGKTTTIRLLCGVVLPTHKTAERCVIQIGERDMLADTERAREQIGYLPQRFSLYEELTVLENLRFFAEARGMAASSWLPRCMEILKFVSLDSFIHRRAGQLSGGMKQKLGLAAALVHRPRVLLLDEPTTGVDPVTRQDFWQLIIRLAADEGIAVLVSTPYMDEAGRCHRVGFMRDGKLMVEGTPQMLRSKLDGRIVEVRGRELPALRHIIRQDPDIENVQLFGDRIHLRTHPGLAESVAGRLGAVDARISAARSVPAQLEDVFIALLEEQV